LAVVFGVNKFRRFLEHAEFLLETDNQALSWLLAHPRQLGKLGRWVVQISSLKFQVQHLRGTQNVVADTLSRMYHKPEDPNIEEAPGCGAVLLEFPLAFKDVMSYQLQDPELATIIENLRPGKPIPRIFCPRVLSVATNREVDPELCCRLPLSPWFSNIITPPPLVGIWVS